jgi:hypothetical protein
MPDRTNAPYDPAAAETSHEWATRVGQEHDTWHRSEGGGPPPYPAKVITAVFPDSIETVEIAAHNLNIIGPDVGDGAVTAVGIDLPSGTTYTDTSPTVWSPTEIRAEVLIGPIAGTANVWVKDAYGQRSNELPITLTRPQAAPTLASITPNTASVTTPTVFDIVALGTGFTLASRVWLGDQQLNSQFFISATELQFDISTSLEPVGEQTVTIRNGSAVSNGLPFTVTP